ncbi:MAG TPA: pantoate--beta-alanine ligase [Oligoflexia bacterium]|nr:pantoate--beta-alanine ligase [Oligoflexia bacterium]HMP47303.1 pantoate--beta-alanine ligase [Oligoflexia bacterium]
MRIFCSIEDLRRELSLSSDSLAIVPTMGALHPGHLSLVGIGKEQAKRVGVSIFVNPAQFNNKNDLDSYPRDIERDFSLLKEVGVDYVFAPTNEVMYGIYNSTKVIPSKLSSVMEGPGRPGHFEGVCTVVAMLFNVFNPDYAVFGEKDFQQLRIIEDMVVDLKFNLEVIRAPIFREEHGLARSSRNELLTSVERENAGVIFRALSEASNLVLRGDVVSSSVLAKALEVLETLPELRVEYLTINREDNLLEADKIDLSVKHRIFFAGNLGRVRLIDNMPLY